MDAALAIRLHALPALLALVIGAAQVALPKGTLPHRTMGWVWVVLMATVAASSFWIHPICTVGGFSAIHALSIFTLVMLPMAVWQARRQNVQRHAHAMKLLYAARGLSRCC
jgi:uncharacterized membrane protein